MRFTIAYLKRRRRVEDCNGLSIRMRWSAVTAPPWQCAWDGSAFQSPWQINDKRTFNLPPIVTDLPLSLKSCHTVHGPAKRVPFVTEQDDIDFDGESASHRTRSPWGPQTTSALGPRTARRNTIKDWIARAIATYRDEDGLGGFRQSPACAWRMGNHAPTNWAGHGRDGRILAT